MEPQEFLALSSQDPEENAAAQEKYREVCEDPQFIFQIFHYITEKTIPQANNLLYNALVHILRLKWNQDIVFWDGEQVGAIISTLTDLLLATAYEQRSSLTECFKVIIQGADFSVLDFVAGLFELLDQHKELENISSLLKVLSFWAKRCSYTVLTVEEQEEIGQQIEDINTNTLRISAAITEVISENILENPLNIEILAQVGKILASLTRKGAQLLADDSFDGLITLFINALAITETSDEITKLKRISSKLLVTLCRTFLGVDIEEDVGENENKQIRSAYAAHFRDEFVPLLQEATFAVAQNDSDDIVLGRVLMIIAILLLNKCIDDENITEDFITDFLIPAARLTPEEVSETENPENYIGTYLYYNTQSRINRRRAAARIVTSLVKSYENTLDPLYDLLLAPTVNPYDFESRIYLMTRYIYDTTSQYGPMIEEDVVDALAGECEKVGEIQTFVNASILGFMKSTLPAMDPPRGVHLASHCIAASDEPVIIIMACKLLSRSVEELMNPIELQHNASELIHKLLEVSAMVHSPAIQKGIQALTKVGGDESTSISGAIVQELLGAIGEEIADPEERMKHIRSSLVSIGSIIQALPPDQAVLAEVCEMVLPQATELFLSDPMLALDEVLFMMCTIGTKIEISTAQLIESSITVLQAINQDEAMISHIEQVACTFCPLISKQTEADETTMRGFYDNCLEYCGNALHYCESQDSTQNDNAYALVMVAALIDGIGEPAFGFLSNVVIGLVSDDTVDLRKDLTLLSAALHALSSGFQNNADATFGALQPEHVNFLVGQIPSINFPTYVETKHAFIVCLFLVRQNPQAYYGAVRMLQRLAEQKVANQMNASIDGTDLVQSLILPFDLPSDQFDEFDLFGKVTSECGLYDSLSAAQKNVISQIITPE